MARLLMTQLVCFLAGTGSLVLYVYYICETPRPHSQFSTDWHSEPVSSEPVQRHNLLIISRPRTGSSFLGQIFNQHPDVFFVYEPLHSLATFVKMNYTKQIEYNRFLRSIFNCRFYGYQDYLTFLSHPGLSSPHFRLSSRALSSPPLCKMQKSKEYANHIDFLRDCPLLKEKVTSDVCAKKKHVVVKVLSHRIPLLSILTLVSLGDSSLRLLYLARDPRGVAWSMLKMVIRENQNHRKNTNVSSSKASSLQFQKQTRALCDQMSLDLKTFETIQTSRFGEAFKILRYEDLAENPRVTAEKVFRFAGINLTPRITTWIQKNTESKTQRVFTYDFYSTTEKNATFIMNAWRNGLTNEQVSIVEKLCSPVMRKLGYVLLRS